MWIYSSIYYVFANQVKDIRKVKRIQVRGKNEHLN